MDEDEAHNGNGATSQDGHPDEDQSTGSAAGSQSDPMIVDGGNLDGGDHSANETEGPRRSSRIQSNQQTQHASDDNTDGTSKPKPYRPKPKPKSKPKPEPERPLGTLSDSGTQSNPIDVDFFHQGSLWDPDGLDAYVSDNHIRRTPSINARFRDSRRREQFHNALTPRFPAAEQGVRASFMLLPLQGRKSDLNPTST